MSADVMRALLDTRTWIGLAADEHGNVLAAHDESGSLQLVEISADGTRRPLTDLPSRCTGRYVPGRREVVVMHDDGGDERWQLSRLDLTDRPIDAPPATLADLQPIVSDPAYMHTLLDVTPTALIYATNRRNGVDMDVVVRRHDGHERVAYDGGGYVVSTVVSHDTRSVAVTRLSLRPNGTAVDVVGPQGVTAATDPDEDANHDYAGWAGGDGALVMSSNRGRDLAAVVRVPLDGGDWSTLVADPAHDLACWLRPDGGAMLVGTLDDGAMRLAVHDIDGARCVDIDLPLGMPTPAWAPDGRSLVVTLVTPTDPGSIHVVDPATGASRLVVDGRAGVPSELRDALVTPRSVRVPTPDGEQVPCFVYDGSAVASSTDRARGACVIHIHGGPESAATRVFSPVIQGLALQGFTVLVPNVRGSTGYGKRWYSLDDVGLRLDSVADLAALHAWVGGQGIDPARVALWGGSYGGYMVLAGLGIQPQLWAAGVDIVGISSLVTFLENTSGYRRAYREREYGRLDADHDVLVQASPITYLGQMQAPLFVIHGANDPRVPLSEAEQIHAALTGRGVPCEIKVYPDEGHGLAKRVNRLDAYPAAVDFLMAHLSATSP